MAREFKENAHLKTDKKKFADNFDSIDWSQAKKWIEEDEALKAAGLKKTAKSKHVSAGMCGEYGMSTFDEKAFKENFDLIRWTPERMATEEELEQLNQESSSGSETSETSSIN